MLAVAGVDCHRDTHSIVFLDEVGRLLKELTITTSTEGYQQALKVAAEFSEVRWGLESTGCYGSAFAKVLLETGAVVYEVPGSFTKRHRKRASETGKSDALDAKAIAEAVLRERDRLPRFQWLAEREAIRLRYDQRDRIVRERTSQGYRSVMRVKRPADFILRFCTDVVHLDSERQLELPPMTAI